MNENPKDIQKNNDRKDYLKNYIENFNDICSEAEKLIDSDEDYVYARNNCNPGFAPGYGIYNLDQDKERFSSMMESYRLATINENNPVGTLPYDLEGFIVYE